MKKLISALLSLTFVTCSFVCNAAEITPVDKTVIYVATNGNDSNEGTENAPLATLEGARDKLREIKNNGKLGKDGAVVYFREGVYNIVKPAELEKQDSGTKNAPITYRAYKDENVSFLGGISVPYSKFKKTTDKGILSQIIDENARDRVCQLDLRSIGYTGKLPYLADMTREGEYVPEKTLTNPIDFYIGDKRLSLARYPNGDKMMSMTTLVKKCQDVDFWLERKYTDPNFIPKEKRDPTDPLIFIPDDNRYMLWPEDSGTSVLRGMYGTGWAWNDALFTIDKESGEVSTKYPLLYMGAVGPGKSAFYVYNMLCELDDDYEMWISDKGILYCILPEGAADEEMFLATCDREMIILGEGTEYITLRGFSFSKAKAGAAKFADGSANNSMYDCEFVSSAVNVEGKNNGVRNSDVVSCSIVLNGGDLEKLISAGNYVENCEVYSGAEVNIIGGVGNRASYNDMHDSSVRAAAVAGKKHIFEFNDVYDVCGYVSDAGAVYGTGISKGGVADRGNIFRYNYFHNINSDHPIQDGVCAIYNDDCSSGNLIVGNIFESINYGKGKGVHLGGSSDMIIDNNIFIDTATGVHFDERASWSTVKDPDNSIILLNLNTANKGYFKNEYWQAEFPELYARYKEIDPKTFAEAWNCRKTNNIYVNVGGDKIADSFKYLVNEDNYETGRDLGFVDAKNGDYMLNEDSPVFESIDFKQIPAKRIGRYTERAVERIQNAVVLKNDSTDAFVKGKKTSIGTEDEVLAPIEIKDSIYIPLRFVSEGMDCKVSWDDKTQSANITTKEGKNIVLTPGSTKAIKDGAEIELPNAPVLYKDRTYVPIRAFGEAVDYIVYWHESGLICVSADDRFNPDADKEIITYLADELDIY